MDVEYVLNWPGKGFQSCPNVLERFEIRARGAVLRVAMRQEYSLCDAHTRDDVGKYEKEGDENCEDLVDKKEASAV